MMRDDAMERLAREKPVSETLPGPPIEPLLRRLDQQPPDLAGRPQPKTRRRRRVAGGTVASVLAVAVALAVAAVAVMYVGHNRIRVQPGNAVSAGSKHGLALSGGNCGTPALITPKVLSSRPPTTSDGLVRLTGGQISGVAWQLRQRPHSEIPGSTQHDQLLLGARRYGLCSQGSVPTPFGLIDAGPHGIVYGYVAKGAGGYRITISEGNQQLNTTITNTFFFIRALPRPACSYRALSVTATSTPDRGDPPGISRALNNNATRFTTTMRFGNCRPHALVRVTAEHGESQGRSPNAALASVTATVELTAAPGSHSHASGTAWELTHDGLRGFRLLAVGLRPGRYGIGLLSAHHQVTAIGTATIKHHELQGAYDLPADGRAHQFVLTAQAPGQTDTRGRVILRATLP